MGESYEKRKVEKKGENMEENNCTIFKKKKESKFFCTNTWVQKV
jgi:hypothetical protein